MTEKVNEIIDALTKKLFLQILNFDRLMLIDNHIIYSSQNLYSRDKHRCFWKHSILHVTSISLEFDCDA